MVTSRVAEVRQGGASAEVVLKKIKGAIARLRRDPPGARSRDLEALMRDCDILSERLEDAAAEAAYWRTRDQPAMPDAVLRDLLAGNRPLRAWRDFRGLTLRGLAARTGVAASTLSEIETGATDGSLRTLRRIAAALDVAIDDLLPDAGD